MSLPNPTALTTTTPYTKFNTTVVLWVPTIATQATPTLAEFNAGKNLTTEISSIAGFDTATDSLDNPKMGTNFVGSLPGREKPNASSIVFELSTAGPTVDVRSVLTQNGLGFIVFCNEGIVSSGYCDVWPVRIGSVSVTQDLEAIAMATVDFNVYRTPTRNILIPTA